MLSRTAENLFWMARYMERAEATARLITMGQRMAILPGATLRDEWRSVVKVTGGENWFDPGALVVLKSFPYLDRPRESKKMQRPEPPRFGGGAADRGIDRFLPSG